MKTFIFTLILTFLIGSLVYSQNITGTLGTGGVFTIKDVSNNFLTLSQLTGNLSVLRNLELGGTDHSLSISGVVTKGGFRFIHNYRAPGTEGFNLFVGLESGNFSMSGGGIQASYNTGVGYRSLFSLTTGYNNSAFGRGSLYFNTTGAFNSSFGNNSLYNNSTGFGNSAMGYFSLYNNTTGNQNSAFGNNSLTNNITGDYNSAFGFNSLSSNTTGAYNTAIGAFSGNFITTGSNNIAIGYNAQVPTGTASNQIRFGNTSITYAGVQVAWTVTSDRRYKDNITPIGLGLGFISKLNPVSYVRKNDEKGRIEYGLIAQEVEQVLKDLGIENHAMLTITDEGMYELRYNDLIAPMIKAIQELKEKSDEKDIEIAKLKGENKEIKSQLNEIIQVVNELKEKQDAVKNVKFGEK